MSRVIVPFSQLAFGQQIEAAAAELTKQKAQKKREAAAAELTKQKAQKKREAES